MVMGSLRGRPGHELAIAQHGCESSVSAPRKASCCGVVTNHPQAHRAGQDLTSGGRGSKEGIATNDLARHFAARELRSPLFGGETKSCPTASLSALLQGVIICKRR